MEALAPGVETRVYVDTGPVIERAFARYSGIGWVGKNTCILNEQKGSWFFLGVILTNLDLAPDPPAPDRCGSCTACLEACPTGALVEPYRMDATRCISYLTIELKGPIPVEFRAAVGNNVFGCDICQDVCPWNRPSSVVRGPWSEAGTIQSSAVSPAPSRPATTEVVDFQPLQLTSNAEMSPASSINNPKSQIQNSSDTRRPTPETFSLFNPSLASLAAMNEEGFRHAFLHSPIKRAKYRGWLRNLCVAMGNSGHPRFIPWLEQIVAGEDAMLCEHAEWALERLRACTS
jgi:epoxyqueuosine reductase